MKRRPARRTTARSGATLWAVAAITLAALAARLYTLDVPVLRWDEGWSLAHASLPWNELWQVATEEWHPPLYVALLKLWLVTGKTVFGIRYLSALLGALAVPLSYAVGRAWSGRRRAGALAAGLAALWPLLVYYGQVTRMYALAVLPVLLAAWFALRLRRQPRALWGLLLSSLVALYTFYYSLWALLGIWLYAALVIGPRRWPRLLAAGLALGAGFAPWLWAARGSLAYRFANSGELGWEMVRGALDYVRPTLVGLAFAYGRERLVAGALGGVLLAGLVLRPPRRGEWAKLALPLAVVGISVAGIALGAQSSRWFAARHIVPASAFLCLLLGWALDRATRRWPGRLIVAVAALAFAYWPISTDVVYQKMLEVVDPFDPAAEHRYLSGRAAPGDLVYFNMLAKAGWYENLRGPGDPAWSYAMRWDPIIEPMEQIAARIAASAEQHNRLWFVLYHGTLGTNAELKDWLDAHLYPAWGEWQGENLYLAYGAPAAAGWAAREGEACFSNGLCLAAGAWTAQAQGDLCAASLAWATQSRLQRDYKVTVQALDEAGRLVAQHDDLPGGPTSRWEPGQKVADRHALFLPADSPARLRLVVGMYDPDTGERLRTPDGADALELGVCASP